MSEEYDPDDHHPDCVTKRRCARAAVLVRCKKCRGVYYAKTGMTMEEGEDWRLYVLDTHYHPERHTPVAEFIITEEHGMLDGVERIFLKPKEEDA